MDKGYIVHAKEKTRAGRTEIHLFGRLESGETFAVVEKRLKPFFHVRAGDAASVRELAAAEGPDIDVLDSDRRTMDGSPLVRIEVPGLTVLQRFRDSLHRAGVRTYEADMKLSVQLLIELGVHGSLCIDGPWREGRRVTRIYENPSLAACSFEPALSVLSVDIETDPRAQKVYAVSLYFQDPASGAESAEVLYNAAGGGNPEGERIRSYPDEKEMLLEVRKRIIDLDPDVITGWNVVDFDLRVLSRRFAALGAPFDIGRSDEPASFLDREDSDGITRWKRSKAIVPGRQVLDGLWLVRFAGHGAGGLPARDCCAERSGKGQENRGKARGIPHCGGGASLPGRADKPLPVLP